LQNIRKKNPGIPRRWRPVRRLRAVGKAGVDIIADDMITKFSAA